MNAQKRTIVAASLAGAVALAIACGSSIAANAPAAGKGQLRVDLVDAPNPAVDEIWVNITRVTAHSTSAGWVTVASFPTPLAVDLLKLQSSAALLGLVDLPPGTVTQLRLVVAPDGNHVVTGGQSVPLKVPSGCESGIKIHGPWEITACDRASVTLDFDGKKSIWYHPTGTGDEWILRPVIRTRASGHEQVGCAPPDAGGADAGTPDAGSGSGEVPPPPPGGTGTVCGEGLPCLSGICGADGLCAPGGPTAPCSAAVDCVSGACAADGTCSPGAAGGAGSACTQPSDCFSNACSEGTCEAGVQGSGCRVAGDCQAPLRCVEGSCAE
jgi:hypothetical protein